MKSLELLFSLLLMLSNVSFTPFSNEAYQEPYAWVAETHSIAHAFGGVDGTSMTNSLEAFLENYEKGQRVFEVDFLFSAEGTLVAAHDWSSFYDMTDLTPSVSETDAPSLAEFKKATIHGEYTPLTWEQIAWLMAFFPDMYVVTDTKYTTEPMITDAFSQIVDVAIDINPSILDRVIPQIYNNDMYNSIFELYPWQSVVYTLYGQTIEEFSYDSVLEFVKANEIKVVTTFPARSELTFIQQVQELGCAVYMHTFNDTTQIEKYIDSHHIQGIYTDFLLPEDVDHLFD